jgi:hypothetical protein
MSKITKVKRVGNMVQVAEYLSAKHKALNSNPTTITPKKQHIKLSIYYT